MNERAAFRCFSYIKHLSCLLNRNTSFVDDYTQIAQRRLNAVGRDTGSLEFAHHMNKQSQKVQSKMLEYTVKMIDQLRHK